MTDDKLADVDSVVVIRHGVLVYERYFLYPTFEYKNSSTELVGAILQKVTGKTVDALARENIFTPLGIDDVDWTRHLGNGFTTSSDGLSLRARDWAKIGQLVLNRGFWEGKKILSASWIAQSTTAQLKARGPFSYGFQWWLGRSSSGDRVVEWTAAMGFNDQKMIIVPELDMVVVFLASHESIYMVRPEIELLNLYILPAILKH